MSSIRVPPKLLAELHKAAPLGTSLPSLLRDLLDQAGGPAAVRSRMERKSRRIVAATQVRRLKAKGHRSVLLNPDEQISLQEACSEMVKILETRGTRSYDPSTRTLWLRSQKGRRPSPSRIRLERSGGLNP